MTKTLTDKQQEFWDALTRRYVPYSIEDHGDFTATITFFTDDGEGMWNTVYDFWCVNGGDFTETTCSVFYDQSEFAYEDNEDFLADANESAKEMRELVLL